MKLMHYISRTLRILPCLLWGALALPGWATLMANPVQYWNEFGSLPVEIKQGAQTMTFIDFKNGMLIAELEGAGEVSMPVSESLVQSLSLKISALPKAQELARNGNHREAVRILRPEVYPLIKFHQVPELFNQLHGPIRTLLDALLRSEDFDEAQFILEKIKLDKAGIKYSERAIRLMNALIALESYEQATVIARMLPVQGPYTTNIRPILNAADSLRAVGQYSAVIPLYQSIERAIAGKAEQQVENRVRMWLAYSLVQADRIEEATPLIDQLIEPDPNDLLFSLYKLVEGTREYRDGNYAGALDLLTRGFVRAQTSYAWVPEMLFYIGDCYKRSKAPYAARNVWTEITTLYPESPWALRAQEAATELPEENPAESESPEPPAADVSASTQQETNT